ncbi:MAG: hypothetical protein WCH75_22535 [Candidatus Binatia bacterium]
MSAGYQADANVMSPGNGTPTGEIGQRRFTACEPGLRQTRWAALPFTGEKRRDDHAESRPGSKEGARSTAQGIREIILNNFRRAIR